MKQISGIDVHQGAMQKFEGYSARFINPDDYLPGNFICFWEKDITIGKLYIAAQGEKPKREGMDKCLYFFLIDHTGTELAHGEIGIIPSGKRKSVHLYFVGSNIRLKGHASCLIQEMAKYQKIIFNYP